MAKLRDKKAAHYKKANINVDVYKSVTKTKKGKVITPKSDESTIYKKSDSSQNLQNNDQKESKPPLPEAPAQSVQPSDGEENNIIQQIYEVFKDLKSWDAVVTKKQIQASRQKLEQLKNNQICSQKNWNEKGNDFTPCAVKIPKNPKQYKAYLKASEQSFKFLVLELLKSDKVDLGTISGNTHTGGNINNSLDNDAYNWLMNDLTQGGEADKQNHFITIFNNIIIGKKTMVDNIYGVEGLNKLNTGDLQYTVTQTDMSVSDIDTNKITQDTTYTLPDAATNTDLIKVILNNIQATTDDQGTTKTANENKLDFLMGQYENNKTILHTIVESQGDGKATKLYLDTLHTIDQENFVNNLKKALGSLDTSGDTPISNINKEQLNDFLTVVSQFETDNSITDLTKEILQLKGWNGGNILYATVVNEAEEDGLSNLITKLKEQNLLADLLKGRDSSGDTAINLMFENLNDVNDENFDSVVLWKLLKGEFQNNSSLRKEVFEIKGQNDYSLFYNACLTENSGLFNEIFEQFKSLEVADVKTVLEMSTTSRDSTAMAWFLKNDFTTKYQELKTAIKTASQDINPVETLIIEKLVDSIANEEFEQSGQYNSAIGNIENFYNQFDSKNKFHKMIKDTIKDHVENGNVILNTIPEDAKSEVCKLVKSDAETSITDATEDNFESSYTQAKSMLDLFPSENQDAFNSAVKDKIKTLKIKTLSISQATDEGLSKLIKEVNDEAQKAESYAKGLKSYNLYLKFDQVSKDLQEFILVEQQCDNESYVRGCFNKFDNAITTYKSHLTELDQTKENMDPLKDIQGNPANRLSKFYEGACQETTFKKMKFGICLDNIKKGAQKQESVLYSIELDKKTALEDVCFNLGKGSSECSEANVKNDLEGYYCDSNDHSDVQSLLDTTGLCPTQSEGDNL